MTYVSDSHFHETVNPASEAANDPTEHITETREKLYHMDATVHYVKQLVAIQEYGDTWLSHWDAVDSFANRDSHSASCISDPLYRSTPNGVRAIS